MQMRHSPLFIPLLLNASVSVAALPPSRNNALSDVLEKFISEWEQDLLLASVMAWDADGRPKWGRQCAADGRRDATTLGAVFRATSVIARPFAMHIKF